MNHTRQLKVLSELKLPNPFLKISLENNGVERFNKTHKETATPRDVQSSHGTKNDDPAWHCDERQRQSAL